MRCSKKKKKYSIKSLLFNNWLLRLEVIINKLKQVFQKYSNKSVLNKINKHRCLKVKRIYLRCLKKGGKGLQMLNRSLSLIKAILVNRKKKVRNRNQNHLRNIRKKTKRKSIRDLNQVRFQLFLLIKLLWLPIP